MIVNREVRDSIGADGYPGKEIILSYVNKEGKISFMRYAIPREWMYQWRYLKDGYAPDTLYQSWDYKPVYKEACTGYFSDQRIHEMLVDIIKLYPQVDEINALNIPDTAYSDIEVNVDPEFGFPDAHGDRGGMMPINTVSWVHEADVTVLGVKPLTEKQIQWIQSKIDEHCAGFKTRYVFKYVYFDTEMAMLDTYFRGYLHPSPCTTGWNWFGYDWPYLYRRAQRLNLDISYLSPTNNWYEYTPQKSNNKIVLPKHKLMYDYMEIYVKWDQVVSVKESNTLDWVSENTIGAKKVEKKMNFTELWEKDPALYVFYNAVDSILVREVDLAIKTSSAFFGLANLMHVDALTAFSPVRSLEIVQTEYLYKMNRVFPEVPRKRKKEGEVDEGYEGAYVYDPTPGIYRNVIALDFASLYPTTMRQFNISPETFILKNKNHRRRENEILCTSGAVYRNDIEGFIPKILSDFYSQRKAYKKDMMIAIDESHELEEIYLKRFGKEFPSD